MSLRSSDWVTQCVSVRGSLKVPEGHFTDINFDEFNLSVDASLKKPG